MLVRHADRQRWAASDESTTARRSTPCRRRPAPTGTEPAGHATSERKRVHQPAEHDRRAEEPANSRPPNRSCSRGVVLGEQREHQRHEEREHDQQEKMTAASLAAEGDVVGVDDDQQIQQAGDDEEGVAVLVGHRADLPGAEPERGGDEIRQADAEVGERRQADQRLGEVERKQPALEPGRWRTSAAGRPGRSAPCAAAEPQMAGARDGPGREAEQHETARWQSDCSLPQLRRHARGTKSTPVADRIHATPRTEDQPASAPGARSTACRRSSIRRRAWPARVTRPWPAMPAADSARLGAGVSGRSDRPQRRLSQDFCSHIAAMTAAIAAPGVDPGAPRADRASGSRAR